MKPRRLARTLAASDVGAPDPTDDDLVARIGAGDERAFEQLAARWGARVRDFLLRVTGDAAAADDLLQEVLVAIFRSAARPDRARPFAVWLFSIARNAALSHLRRRAATTRLFELLATAPRALIARFERRLPQPPPEELIGDEFAVAFDAALRALPEEFRAVFLLREREELSYEEIAAIVGIPAKTVSTRLVRARERLRRHLAPWFEAAPRGASPVARRSPS